MKKTLLTALVILILLLSGCCSSKKQAAQRTQPTPQPPVLTLAEYEQIPIAATYEETVKIIGAPGKKNSEYISGDFNSTGYEWETPMVLSP